MWRASLVIWKRFTNSTSKWLLCYLSLRSIVFAFDRIRVRLYLRSFRSFVRFFTITSRTQYSCSVFFVAFTCIILHMFSSREVLYELEQCEKDGYEIDPIELAKVFCEKVQYCESRITFFTK